MMEKLSFPQFPYRAYGAAMFSRLVVNVSLFLSIKEAAGELLVKCVYSEFVL